MKSFQSFFLIMLIVLSSAGDLKAYDWLPSKDEFGWSHLQEYLVESDGSRSLGVIQNFNDARDTGSKILFFDPENGNNETAQVYWWDGSKIIDSEGNDQNAQGLSYGTDPLEPNLEAISAFAHVIGMRGNADGDLRIRTNHRDQYRVSGYADWFLFRRGVEHTLFDGELLGGRSGTAPMVVAGYGPRNDGRAVFNPEITTVEYEGSPRETIANPINAHTGGNDTLYLHMVFAGLELPIGVGFVGAPSAFSPSGGPVTLHMEDCKVISASMNYLPQESYIYRSISAWNWNPDSHNQGYYTSGFSAKTFFEESVFYKNGYKEDPRTHADPRRDIYSRNIYQGGGAQMGHVYKGLISADGASGGPQMRLGGKMENSLIIEGYFYSSTNSNQTVNEWLPGQEGSSAQVKNNVQFIFSYPNYLDSDTYDVSDNRAQPGWGYSLSAATFGNVVEGNIISGVMMNPDSMTFNTRQGIGLSTNPESYQDGIEYSLKNNVVRNNIAYATREGLRLSGDFSIAENNIVENNVFVSRDPMHIESLSGADSSRVFITNNRFYHLEESLDSEEFIDLNNESMPYQEAASEENFPDPDRTLLRYVTEELGLTLLDWQDDPWLPASEIEPRAAAGEAYDPFGLKTFMAVATNMRQGGAMAPPSSGKPDWQGDYAWDTKYSAYAVLNYIRAGFGLDSVSNVSGDDISNGVREFEFQNVVSSGFQMMQLHFPEIYLNIPDGGKYSLELYDNQGRRVIQLFEKELKKGQHFFSIYDLKSLPALQKGIMHLRLQSAGGYQETGTLLYLGE
jgi:hypothetical protein